MTTAQHGGLTIERWAGFARDRQVLMIANEMHRAGKLLGPEDRQRLRGSLERVMVLTDLTIAVQPRPTFRRELLRWRDLVAALYVAAAPAQREHRAAFAALLLLTPESAKQIPYVLREPATD